MKEQGIYNAAVNSGVIPITVAGHCDIYEYFLEIKTKHDKRTSITIVSEDKKVCEATVYNIIKDFGC